jgi:hypothetical protein
VARGEKAKPCLSDTCAVGHGFSHPKAPERDPLPASTSSARLGAARHWRNASSGSRLQVRHPGAAPSRRSTSRRRSGRRRLSPVSRPLLRACPARPRAPARSRSTATAWGSRPKALRDSNSSRRGRILPPGRRVDSRAAVARCGHRGDDEPARRGLDRPPRRFEGGGGCARQGGERAGAVVTDLRSVSPRALAWSEYKSPAEPNLAQSAASPNV